MGVVGPVDHLAIDENPGTTPKAFAAPPQSGSLAPRIADRPQLAIMHEPIAFDRHLERATVAIDPAADFNRIAGIHLHRGVQGRRVRRHAAGAVERQERSCPKTQPILGNLPRDQGIGRPARPEHFRRGARGLYLVRL